MAIRRLPCPPPPEEEEPLTVTAMFTVRLVRSEARQRRVRDASVTRYDVTS